MTRIISVFGLAVSAALMSQSALAQSASVDALANVVTRDSTLSIGGENGGEFGDVTIPSGAESVCRYIVGRGPDNLTPTPSGVQTFIYGPQTNTGPSANPEPGVCQFGSVQAPPEFTINCIEGSQITVSLSYNTTSFTTANNIGFRAYNPLDAGLSAYGPPVKTGTCLLGAVSYYPVIELTLTSDSGQISGVVGTITAEVSY